MLKTAAFAPMPSPSVSATVRVNPGCLNSMRSPSRMSCQRVSNITSSSLQSLSRRSAALFTREGGSIDSEGRERIETRGPPRGNEARRDRDQGEQECNRNERHRIRRRNLHDQRLEDVADAVRGQESERQTDRELQQPARSTNHEI